MKKNLLIIFMLIGYCGFSQNPADVDPTFNNSNNSGFNQSTDVVNAVMYSSFAKVYLGGFFSSYFGTTANNIACININGGIDTSLITGIGFNNTVNCIIETSSGKIMVGGNFTNYNGIASNRIILLNPDGSIDNSFEIGSGFNGNVLAIAIQSDGKLIIGGDFTTYNGNSVSKIVRLNSNGSIDTSFSIGTGFNNSIKSIAVQTDGKVLIGGSFTLYNGVNKNRIVRLNSNGAIDTSFFTTTGFNNNVNKIVLLSDGSAVLGGDFTTCTAIVSGVTTQVSKNRIIKLSTDGTINTTFGIGTGFNSTVYNIYPLVNGKIIICGNYTTYKGVISNKITRLNADGTVDATFISNGNGLDNSVLSIAVGAKILIGGSFNSTVNTVSGPLNSNRIRALNDDGSFFTSFANNIGIYPDSSVPNNVIAIAIKSDGKILVGGNSETYNSSISNSIVLLDNNGYVDSSFSSGTGFTGANPYIRCIVPQPDGKILVSGYFTYYNGVQFTKYITRLNSNGSIDNSFSTSSLQNYSTYLICLQPDGKIILGETNYTYYNGIPSAHIIRLNNDGTIDNSFVSGSGFNIGITSIVQQTDGKILVGGNFSTYNGISANKIIRLNTNGSLDTSFVTGIGFDNIVYNIAVQSDNKILIGGNFLSYNGSVAKRIIRLNTNGSLDNSFTVSGTGFDKAVAKIKVLSDGKILVGGSFTNYNGIIANNLIRLNSDATKDNLFLTEATPNNTVSNSSVNDIAIQNDGKILVVGSHFNTIDNTRRSIARLSGGTAPLSNNEFQIDKLKIYPNPVKDILNVANTNNFSNYEIFNLLGSKIISGTITNGQIMVSDLTNGIYIIKIKDGNKIVTNKFIKK